MTEEPDTLIIFTVRRRIDRVPIRFFRDEDDAEDWRAAHGNPDSTYGDYYVQREEVH